MAKKEDKRTDADVLVIDKPKKLKAKSHIPPRYKVLLYNDDVTTMEFVIEVLKKFFHKNEDEAVQIMLHVHERGVGVAGEYMREIAETKVVQVTQYARGHHFPLKVSAEEC